MVHTRDVMGVIFDDDPPFVVDSIRLAHLSELMQALGYEPTATRAILSRMRREGAVATEKVGRETLYSATTSYREHLARTRARSAEPVSDLWSGRWCAVLFEIPEAERARREKLKRHLADQGFGRLNPTTWISTREDLDRVREIFGSDGDPRVRVVSLETGSLQADRALTRECWDLDEIRGYYESFIARWSGMVDSSSRLLPSDAFRALVTASAEWRHFPHHDPRFPRPLQPDGWPADAAAALYEDLVFGLREKGLLHVRSVVES